MSFVALLQLLANKRTLPTVFLSCTMTVNGILNLDVIGYGSLNYYFCIYFDSFGGRINKFVTLKSPHIHTNTGIMLLYYKIG